MRTISRAIAIVAALACTEVLMQSINLTGKYRCTQNCRGSP